MPLSRSKPTTWFAGLGCLALILAGGSPARADNIDKELVSKAGFIMKDLQTHGYKNVGVLKFLVKRGNTPPIFTAGKLNYLMATRLENALVMVNKDSAPIGIARGASAVAAAKDKNATYQTAEGRQNLFQYQYPLAWGSQEVMVDAFLTGTIDISADLAKTTITIKAFEKNAEPRDVVSMTVDTDLAILRDTNQNFVVARRSFNSWANAEDPDEELNKLAVKDIVVKETVPAVKGSGIKEKPKDLPRQAVEALKDYLDIRILYNGQAVEIDPDGFLSKPAAGQTVLIKLNAKIKIGLLLRINGINTLNEQADEKSNLAKYSWWVLEPGVEYTIRGFYKDGKVRPFVAMSPAEVDIASDLGENVERHGKIEFDVFVDPTVLAKVAAKERKRDFSFRPVMTGAATLEQLKAQIRENMPVKNIPEPRIWIVGGATENQQLTTTTFDGRHVAGVAINYRQDLRR
jgi:hypothetical protein